ncbi:hypothetical protein DL96DRAFT_1600205 [Flagelloscypha sp. PMI_526]|nr:hypothetical protein DL96DRAFT_1600205 [Flagelloscypha sp. PMI_526]
MREAETSSEEPPPKRVRLSQEPAEHEPNGQTTPNLPTEAEAEEEEEEDNCSICLHPYNDRTLIPTCSHEFCFECILVWSEQSRRCPLCAANLGDYLIHKIRSKFDYEKRYLPPLASKSPKPHVPLQPMSVTGRRRQARPPVRDRWGPRDADDEEDRLDRSIQRRKWLYERHLFAKHVASNAHTRFKPYPTPAQFAASPELISRTITFLRRELRVWVSLDIEFLTTFIISMMKSIDIRSESAVKLLSEFLDMDTPYAEGYRHPNAEHFAHEVYTYVRSPFKDLFVYDAAIQYDETPPTSFHSNATDPSTSNRNSAGGRRRSPSPSPVRRSPSLHRRSSSPPSCSPSPRYRSLSFQPRSPSPQRPTSSRRARHESRTQYRARSPPRRPRSPSPRHSPSRRSHHRFRSRERDRRSRSRDMSWSPSGRYYSSRSKRSPSYPRWRKDSPSPEPTKLDKGKGRARSNSLSDEEADDWMPMPPPKRSPSPSTRAKYVDPAPQIEVARERKPLRAPKRSTLSDSIRGHLSQATAQPQGLSFKIRREQHPLGVDADERNAASDIGDNGIPLLLKRMSEGGPTSESLPPLSIHGAASRKRKALQSDLPSSNSSSTLLSPEEENVKADNLARTRARLEELKREGIRVEDVVPTPDSAKGNLRTKLLQKLDEERNLVQASEREREDVVPP